VAGCTFRAAPVRVRVPASSANVGPGFDACGLALGLYNDVVIKVVDEGLFVDIAGEDADTLPRNRRNLVVAAMYAAFDQLGGRPRGLEVVCANRIPPGRGLGSSSAAVVAGIVAARSVTVGGAERLDDGAVLGLATELDGHPDNAAACLLGGFTVAWIGSTGPQSLRLAPDPSVVPVVFVPAATLSTKKSRALLPATVPHADAARNAGRAALLTAAVTSRPDLLFTATHDELHQRYRGPAMLPTERLLETLRSGGIAATLSGAGPAVLALTTDDRAAEVGAFADHRWTVMRLAVDQLGASIVPLDG
jgi:homoserine kinase